MVNAERRPQYYASPNITVIHQISPPLEIVDPHTEEDEAVLQISTTKATLKSLDCPSDVT